MAAFEGARHQAEDGVELWFGRDLMKLFAANWLNHICSIVFWTAIIANWRWLREKAGDIANYLLLLISGGLSVWWLTEDLMRWFGP